MRTQDSSISFTVILFGSLVRAGKVEYDSSSQGDLDGITVGFFSGYMGRSLPTESRTRGDIAYYINVRSSFWRQFALKTMYQGVLRDDERRREKMKQREADLQESLRKREEYERVQPVSSTNLVWVQEILLTLAFRRHSLWVHMKSHFLIYPLTVVCTNSMTLRLDRILQLWASKLLLNRRQLPQDTTGWWYVVPLTLCSIRAGTSVSSTKWTAWPSIFCLDYVWLLTVTGWCARDHSI